MELAHSGAAALVCTSWVPQSLGCLQRREVSCRAKLRDAVALSWPLIAKEWQEKKQNESNS